MANIKSVIETAKKELAGLTGFANPAGVAVRKNGDGWTVNVEIVEKKSIPEGMDILGLYEVQVGSQGDITGYARKGMRKRVDTAGAQIE